MLKLSWKFFGNGSALFEYSYQGVTSKTRVAALPEDATPWEVVFTVARVIVLSWERVSTAMQRASAEAAVAP